MPTVNQYFQSGKSIGVASEQNLYEDLIIESLKIYGHEIYYLPRKPAGYDDILTENTGNYFENAYPSEMYMENVQGFQGEGDLLTKFGLEIRDSANFIVARKRWSEIIGSTGNSILPERPAEGDIIYFPLTKGFFEIRKVDGHEPFYQVGKLYTFKLYCELMQFSNEKFNTGVSEIDEIAAGFDIGVGNFELMQENGETILLETDELTPAIQEGYTSDKPFILADNEKFEREKNTVLDFSERNPFGDV
jgi:hypothetical protein